MAVNGVNGMQATQQVSFCADKKVDAQPKVDMESKDTVEFSTKAEAPKGSKSKKIGAGVASFLYPGLGQLCNGEPKKAAKYALGAIGLDLAGAGVGIALSLANPVAGIAWGLAVGAAHIGLNIASIVDAVKSADK